MLINIILAILFSLSANFDNIVIGISYGIKKIHIPFIKNCIIAIFTTAITFASMKFASYITCIIDENFANVLGATSLILIGLVTLIKEGLKIFKNNAISDTEIHITKNISFKELFTLIFALSLNNIATRYCSRCYWDKLYVCGYIYIYF